MESIQLEIIAFLLQSSTLWAFEKLILFSVLFPSSWTVTSQLFWHENRRLITISWLGIQTMEKFELFYVTKYKKRKKKQLIQCIQYLTITLLYNCHKSILLEIIYMCQCFEFILQIPDIVSMRLSLHSHKN